MIRPKETTIEILEKVILQVDVNIKDFQYFTDKEMQQVICPHGHTRQQVLDSAKLKRKEAQAALDWVKVCGP